MNNRREKSFRAALGGIMSAAALVSLLLGSMLPFATYSAPALASLCVLIFFDELGTSAALTMYAAVSVLGVILCPDKEAAFMFVFLLGWYPIAKSRIDRLPSRAARAAVKLALFNLAVGLMYALLIKVFMMGEIADDFRDFSAVMFAAFAAAGNLTFVIFDVLLTKITLVYTVKLRPRLLSRL